MGLTNGLNANGLASPMRLVTSSIGSNQGPAIVPNGATAQAALQSVATPLRAPFSAEGSFAGAAGGSPQARSGATAALLNHPINGAGTW